MNWFLNKARWWLLTLALAHVLLHCQNVLAKQVFPFQGEIDFSSQKAHIEIDTGEDSEIKLEIKNSSLRKYEYYLIVEGLRTSFFDISTEIKGVLELKNNKGVPRFKGSLESQYTLLNHKPVRELTGSFYTHNQWFYLNAITLGNLVANGKVLLKYPFDQEFSLVLSYVSLDAFLDFWIRNKTFESEGSVSGEIKSNGNIEKLYLKGKLSSEHGYIKNLFFDKLLLNLEGDYPLMDISQSLLSQSGGMIYSFSGPFDLSRKKEFKKQISELTFSPIIDQSGSDVEWTIKRVEDKPDSSIELKYLLRNEKSLGGHQDEDSGMIGIEREMKF